MRRVGRVGVPAAAAQVVHQLFTVLDQAQIDRPPPFFQGVLDQQAVVWIVVGQ